MASSSHALLGPSSSKMWINCNPSARLNESLEDVESSFAAEGTRAHLVCENKLLKALGQPHEILEPSEEFDNEEIDACSDDYVNFVMECYEEAKSKCKDPIVLIEQYLDLTRWIPESFGTGDSIVAGDGTLYVIDYKHGKGVRVESQGNTQTMIYALGALEIFDCLYEINEISMTIFQPRLGNVSTTVIKKDELLKWADEILIPNAERAFKGEGKASCGDWCRFCKSKAMCRERANFNMALASKEFAEGPLLTDEEIEEVLMKVDGLVSWASEIKDYAFQRALSGYKFEHFKLVAGRANRKYSDEEAVANAVIDMGMDPYDKKVCSITEMQKRIGKKNMETLSQFIVKPEGKPTLVERSDKRPELEINSAKDDFMTTEEK